MSPPFPHVLQHPLSCVYGNQDHFLLGKQRGAFDSRGKGRRAECALWDWASSSSPCWPCWSPARTQKVTGCLGEEGLTGCPRAPGWTGLPQQGARPLSHPCAEAWHRGSGSWFAGELGAASRCMPHHSRGLGVGQDEPSLGWYHLPAGFCGLGSWQEGWSLSVCPSPALPCSLWPQETWILTGLAQHPSAWGAARGSTRS